MKTDIAIVGAGLVGLSLAAGLRGSGLRVVLLDSQGEGEAPQFEWDPRIYAISPGSKAYLAQCGAWQRLPAERIARVQAMQVHGDGGGAEIRFSASQAGLPELCFIVESRALQGALRAVTAEQPDITALYGVRASGLALDAESALLELSGGEHIEARLIVAADGAQSWVRDSAGIAAKVWPYRQQGVVANFNTEYGHLDIARQWFRSDGVLALLPLPGNRTSIVWSTWDDVAQRLLAMPSDDFAREVELAAQHALGAMEVITPPRSFPLALMTVQDWVRPRLALIGDAAHTVHPLAGQGVNLGFQDARVLAEVLRTRGAQDDCGDYRLLRRYARARSEPVALMQATTDGLHRLFTRSGPGMKWLRNAGLQLTNGIVPLKGLLVANALG